MLLCSVVGLISAIDELRPLFIDMVMRVFREATIPDDAAAIIRGWHRRAKKAGIGINKLITDLPPDPL